MTIADQLLALNTVKQNIKTAIEAKGVTVGAAPFTDYPTKISEIPVGDPAEAIPTVTPWARPADWLALPAITQAESKFVGLHAVFPDANYLSLSASGAYTVNWGDGVVENFASGAVASHVYDFNNAALNGTLTSRGYKQAIVTVTPQAGQTFTMLNLDQRHPTVHAVAAVKYSSQWLDIAIAGPSLNSLTIALANPNVRPAMLEQVKLYQTAITNFGSLFAGCRALASLPVFQTAGATSFSSTFSGCYCLKELTEINASSCTNFSSMFNSCYNLVKAPVMDTSAGTNFANCFDTCYSLVYVPNYNLASATSLMAMFNACRALRENPVFINTGNVTSFAQLFNGCYSLKKFKSFDTSKGTDFSSMFNGCASLEEVELFDTSKATSLASTFRSCWRLKEIPAINTGLCTNFSAMFQDSPSFKTIPLLNTAAGITFTSMFNGCSALAEVPLLNFGNATAINNMFANCRALETVPLFNTANVTDISGMFSNCTSLREVPLFNTAKVTTMASMFNNCTVLRASPSFNTPVCLNFNSMFFNCSNLQSVGAMDLSKVTSSSGYTSMFNGCEQLANIDCTGIKFTISVSSCKLSADRLNEIYTNLATVTGQILTVTGNVGTTGDNPAIATAKGWTVTG